MKINNFAMSVFSNAYHAAFHHAVASQLTDSDAESMGLAASFLSEYGSAIDYEQDIVNRTLGSAKTDLMGDKDKLRDNLFRAVRNALRNTKYSSNETIKALYPLINKQLLTPYSSAVCNEADQRETALLMGFKMDVEKFLTASQIELIGIKADLEAMAAANDQFEALYLARVDEYVANPAGFSEKCRAAVDACWEKLVNTINYFANERNNPDADVQLKAVAASSFAELLNEIIRQHLASVKASGSRKKKNTSSENGGANGTGNSGTSGSQDSGNSGTQDSGNSGTGGKTDGGKADGGNTVVVGPTEATDKKEDSGASQNENGGHVSF